MKKVGIITIYQNNRNYGGLLQAYALQKAIESQDCSCEIINYTQDNIAYKWNRMRNLGLIRTLEIIRNKVATRIEYTLTAKNKIPCFITIISGLLNVLGMYVLIKYTDAGIHAVVLTTTVLTWLVNFVFNPMYVSHCLRVRLTTFYPTLIRHIASSIALLFLFKMIGTLYYPTSWFGLVIIALCCAMIGSVVHMVITLNRSEWQVILRKIII